MLRSASMLVTAWLIGWAEAKWLCLAFSTISSTSHLHRSNQWIALDLEQGKLSKMQNIWDLTSVLCTNQLELAVHCRAPAFVFSASFRKPMLVSTDTIVIALIMNFFQCISLLVWALGNYAVAFFCSKGVERSLHFILRWEHSIDKGSWRLKGSQHLSSRWSWSLRNSWGLKTHCRMTMLWEWGRRTSNRVVVWHVDWESGMTNQRGCLWLDPRCLCPDQ